MLQACCKQITSDKVVLGKVAPIQGKKANKRPPFFRGLTVLRNATNFREKRDKQNRETSRSL